MIWGVSTVGLGETKLTVQKDEEMTLSRLETITGIMVVWVVNMQQIECFHNGCSWAIFLKILLLVCFQEKGWSDPSAQNLSTHILIRL